MGFAVLGTRDRLVSMLTWLAWSDLRRYTHRQTNQEVFSIKKNFLRPLKGARHVAQTVPIQYKCWCRPLMSFLCHPCGNKTRASGYHKDETYFWATSTYLSKFLTAAWRHSPRAMSLKMRSSRSLHRSLVVPILILHLKVTAEQSPQLFKPIWRCIRFAPRTPRAHDDVNHACGKQV